MSSNQQALLSFGSVATDPSFASVVQLAHFGGTNGSQVFTNSCPRGNTLSTSLATISTAQSVFGGTSLRINSGDEATATTHADYTFGTNDLTVEFRVRPDTVSATGVLLDMRLLENASLRITLYYTSDGVLHFYVNGADRITSAGSTIIAATWKAIAYSRIGTSGKLFVDGTQVGSTYTDSNTYTTAQITLGRGPIGGAPMAGGYFDELRLTNGVGRYGGNYTIAAAPFANA